MASQDYLSFHWKSGDFDGGSFEIRGRTLFFALLLFCLILSITLFYLYVKWNCRFRRILSSASPSTPPPGGLDPSTINSLPITLHKGSANQSHVECTICLGVFEDGEKVKVLPDCRHCYHSECVDKWLITQSSCPLCRASLSLVSLV